MKRVLFVKLIKEFILEKKEGRLEELIKTVNVVDFSEILRDLSHSERDEIYKIMTPEQIASVFLEIDSDLREEIIILIDKSKLKEVFNYMSDDDLADVFEEFSEEEVNNFMNLLADDHRENIKELITHDSDTAGGLMTKSYFSVDKRCTVGEALSQIKSEHDAEMVYYVYVLDDDDTLLGVVSLRDVLISDPIKKITRIMNKKVISVSPDTNQEEVSLVFSRYSLFALPVLENGIMKGIITVDDIIDVMEEEATKDIYRMAGLADDEETDGIMSSVKARLPWILVSFFGEIISALIMLKNNKTLGQITALAFFIPLIMAMGGNSGSQSSAIMVRKIALGEKDQKDFLKIFFKEGMSGFIIGLISAVMVFVIVSQGLIGGSPDMKLAFIIGIALFFAIFIAACIGVLIPFAFEKLGVDPAVASGPFITTLNDVGGILIYFTLATVLLKI